MKHAPIGEEEAANKTPTKEQKKKETTKKAKAIPEGCTCAGPGAFACGVCCIRYPFPAFNGTGMPPAVDPAPKAPTTAENETQTDPTVWVCTSSN